MSKKELLLTTGSLGIYYVGDNLLEFVDLHTAHSWIIYADMLEMLIEKANAVRNDRFNKQIPNK